MEFSIIVKKGGTSISVVKIIIKLIFVSQISILN